MAKVKRGSQTTSEQGILWRWYGISYAITYLKNLINFSTGYWSAGTRLADSAVVSGQGLDAGELPEYIVGVLLVIPGHRLLMENSVWWRP